MAGRPEGGDVTTALEVSKKPSGLKGWVVDLLAKMVADERIQATIKNIVGQVVAEKIMPLVPVAAAAAATAAMNAAVKKWPGLEDTIETVVEVGQVVQETRTGLNELIPDIDFGIEALDRVLDSWRPK